MWSNVLQRIPNESTAELQQLETFNNKIELKTAPNLPIWLHPLTVDEWVTED